MKIIVGSKALEHFGLSPRKSKDVDYWISHTESVPVGDTKVIPLKILISIPTTSAIHCYATPDAIYTIKRSHAMYDIHWDKTISDILYLKKKGCKLIPELHHKLVEYWKTIHGDKSFLSLNKTKADFFNDYVEHTYDHDLLHEIVAYESNVPLYTKVLKDNQEVLIDRLKFMALSKHDQINLFREEIYVIALERWLIRSNFRIPIPVAYRLALKKTITNLTKGWATEFILDNIEEYAIMNTRFWVKNFYKHIGKDTTMHPIIQKVKDKADELNIHDDGVAEVLHHAYDEGAIYEKSEDEFEKFLHSLGFKAIESVGGEDMGTCAHAVIELEGQIFRADFSYASYDGYYIDDVWDWTPVEKKTKEVTVYE